MFSFLKVVLLYFYIWTFFLTFDLCPKTPSYIPRYMIQLFYKSLLDIYHKRPIFIEIDGNSRK